jgi:RNA polymerase sigma-70 factor (ECF subfamily)
MDLQLVERARDGDRAAFGEIVVASLGELDRTARLITRDAERAKDAVQETLVKAWRDLPGLRDCSRFEAWLRQLLVRSCIDEIRRGRRRVVEVELIDLHQATGRDVSLSVADRDALDRAFRRLDAEQRVLVVMHYYADLPLDAIASTLGIPLGTAKSRLSRGRASLRAALEADARTGVAMAEGRAS